MLSLNTTLGPEWSLPVSWPVTPPPLPATSGTLDLPESRMLACQNCLLSTPVSPPQLLLLPALQTKAPLGFRVEGAAENRLSVLAGGEPF